MHKYPSISLSLLLAATAVAQVPSVIPSRYATTEGGGNSEGPARWAPLHMQALYNNTGIATGTASFTGIRFRPDSGNANTLYTAHTETVQLSLSSAGVPAPASSYNRFETNRGTNHVAVFNGTINFPKISNASGPRPFTINFPFTAPFAYTSGDNLLVEIIVRGTSFMDYDWITDATPGIAVSPNGSVMDVGSACPTANSLRVPGSPPWIGAPLIATATSGAMTGLPTFTALGTQNQFIRLDPFGAPGCTLYQDIAFTLQGTVGAGGIVTADFGRIPTTPGTAGGKVRIQQFVLDPMANNLSLRATQGLEVTIGNGFPQTLEAHAWYGRRNNTGTLFPTADFRSTRTPIIQVY